MKLTKTPVVQYTMDFLTEKEMLVMHAALDAYTHNAYASAEGQAVAADLWLQLKNQYNEDVSCLNGRFHARQERWVARMRGNE